MPSRLLSEWGAEVGAQLQQIEPEGGDQASVQLLTKTFEVPLNFLELVKPPPSTASNPFSTHTPYQSFMGHYGVVLKPGCQALFNPEKGILKITNTADQLELIGSVIATFPVLSDAEEEALVSSIIALGGDPPVISGVPDKRFIKMKYFLPPDIYKKFISGPPTGIAADPFAPEPSEEFKAGKRTPQSVFENAGISFPPGTNAGYDKSKGELFVTTTLEQLDLVEAYLSALDGGTMILGSDSRFHKDKTGSP